MLNIFFLSSDLSSACKYMFDCHISKGLLELVQIFFTARNMVGVPEKAHSYKPKQKYSGVVQWAAHSYQNYLYLVKLAEALNNEYMYRYQATQNHKSYDVLLEAFSHDDDVFAEQYFPLYGFTRPCQAMPMFYMHDSYIVGYRAYYFFYKRYSINYINWTMRPTPHWYNEEYFIANGYRFFEIC